MTFAVHSLVYQTEMIYNCRKRRMPIYPLDSYTPSYNTRWDSPLYAIFGSLEFPILLYSQISWQGRFIA
jgi:hypothetical protein